MPPQPTFLHLNSYYWLHFNTLRDWKGGGGRRQNSVGGGGGVKSKIVFPLQKEGIKGFSHSEGGWGTTRVSW